MLLRRHHDEAEVETRDPLAARVWQAGLPHVKAVDPVIRAPHAADLVTPASTEPSHRDAA